jgi:hypothetical protein
VTCLLPLRKADWAAYALEPAPHHAAQSLHDAAHPHRLGRMASRARGRHADAAQDGGRGGDLPDALCAGLAVARPHPSGRRGDLSGKGRLDDLPIAAGDFIWTPPGEAQVLHAETEVVIHVTLPGPIVITE